MSELRCITCQRDIAPDEQVYEIRTFLDPLPPGGVACSEQCQQRKEGESKQRAMFWYQTMGNPFGGDKNE
jgi:predicted nucleic acid-binding Zn ribbon protein